jgi:hypothetical protein
MQGPVFSAHFAKTLSPYSLAKSERSVAATTCCTLMLDGRGQRKRNLSPCLGAALVAINFSQMQIIQNL